MYPKNGPSLSMDIKLRLLHNLPTLPAIRPLCCRFDGSIRIPPVNPRLLPLRTT